MCSACRLTLRFHPWTREKCRCAWRSTSLATRHARCLASTSRAIGLSGLRRTAQRMGCLLRVSAGPHCSAPGSARLVEKCGPLLRSESTGDASTAGCRLRHSGRSVGRSGWDAWPPRGQKLRLAETIRCDGGMPPVDALVLKSEAAGCSRFPHLNGRETRSECAPVRNHATHKGSLVGCRYADSAHLRSGQLPSVRAEVCGHQKISQQRRHHQPVRPPPRRVS
jgi:hypothetical protein